VSSSRFSRETMLYSRYYAVLVGDKLQMFNEVPVNLINAGLNVGDDNFEREVSIPFNFTT
jgi:hypothetical protein